MFVSELKSGIDCPGSINNIFGPLLTTQQLNTILTTALRYPTLLSLTYQMDYDPEKPPCPYKPGFKVGISRVTPPLPYGKIGIDVHGWRDLRWWCVDIYSSTQTRVVMEYPPLDHDNRPADPAWSGEPTAWLTIIRTLGERLIDAADDGSSVTCRSGPWIVVCFVIPIDPREVPFEAVAKIYDPLYYPFGDQGLPYTRVNVAKLAEVDFTHEANALAHLQTKGQSGHVGLSCPEYYGAWSYNLPITYRGLRVQRCIRLVLMELIRGPSLRSLTLTDAFSRYSTDDRLETFAMVLDAAARQRFAGVHQGDLAARNVVLRPSPPMSAANGARCLPQPVIIDYNRAVVYELSCLGRRGLQSEKLPDNPLQIFWDSSFSEFNLWLPPAFDSAAVRQEWLRRRFGQGEAEKQYAPLNSLRLSTREKTKEAEETEEP
ncbi:uncharacterized protein B0T15DRAFT_548289 [Chaetomium strumarium]|uniref:Protein kinase domain-containing protein n=1 Tax=Chaetomium strumarium TaxID=1170767 RepID=A0AAJ0M6Y3_9PEZI|nr:hypothetical protein B0T15DRAFT_548289 [Chaetomium strumarium]